jgi:hypothetical protein
MGAALIRADLRTEMVKIIGGFYDNVNGPKMGECEKEASRE